MTFRKASQDIKKNKNEKIAEENSWRKGWFQKAYELEVNNTLLNFSHKLLEIYFLNKNVFN